jgi:nucleotidyltransferase substrate binding protein (TIGR01987 family)
METEKDTRWIQRYNNFHRACQRLVEVTESDRFASDLSELEKEGLIQRFEYTYELAWKTLQDLLLFKGYDFMSGPNGTLKQAFEDGIIVNHDAWRRMGKSRNTVTHTYDEADALAVVEEIFQEYAPLLKVLDEKLTGLSQQKEYQ